MSLSSGVFSIESGLSLALGAFLFFFPNCASELIINENVDDIHSHLLRCVGGEFLALGYVLWRLRASRKAKNTCQQCGMTMSLLFILFSLNTNSSNFNWLTITIFKWICLGIFCINFILFVIDTWHTASLFSTTDVHKHNREYSSMRHSRGTRNTKSTEEENEIHATKATTVRVIQRIVQVNSHCFYSLDAIVGGIVGVIWITFPKWILNPKHSFPSEEDTYLFLSGLIGSIFLSMAWFSSNAHYWKGNRTKHVVVDGRVLMSIFLLIAQFWDKMGNENSWSNCTMVAFFSIWAFLSVLCRFIMLGENFTIWTKCISPL